MSLGSTTIEVLPSEDVPAGTVIWIDTHELIKLLREGLTPGQAAISMTQNGKCVVMTGIGE